MVDPGEQGQHSEADQEMRLCVLFFQDRARASASLLGCVQQAGIAAVWPPVLAPCAPTACAAAPPLGWELAPHAVDGWIGCWAAQALAMPLLLSSASRLCHVHLCVPECSGIGLACCGECC